MDTKGVSDLRTHIAHSYLEKSAAQVFSRFKFSLCDEISLQFEQVNATRCLETGGHAQSHKNVATRPHTDTQVKCNAHTVTLFRIISIRRQNMSNASASKAFEPWFKSR